MDSIPNLRTAYRLTEKSPASDSRSMILESLKSIIDYCECAMPHGDREFPEYVGKQVALFVRRGDWMGAVVAVMNGRMDIAAASDETYCEDEPHGCRMPMGGDR